MAKKNNPYLLFAIGTCLLSAGWVMKSFPLLIFTGLAPLFAITDQVNPKKSFWTFFELILLALSVSLFAANLFSTQYLVPVLVQSIVFTCSFVAHSFVRQNLGPWLSKFFILTFWLGFEYVFLKLSWPNPTLFLADALLLKTEWLRWTQYTGYLGATAWILICNLMLYYALLKHEKINVPLLGVYFVLLIGPILYSYTLTADMMRREDMIALYDHKTAANPYYFNRGEYIPRTAVFISGLVLIFAVVRNKTQKK